MVWSPTQIQMERKMTGCIPCCCSKDLEEQELLDEPTNDPLLCTCRGREYHYRPAKGARNGMLYSLVGIVASCVAIWSATAIGWTPNNNDPRDTWQQTKWIYATGLVVIGSIGLLASVVTTSIFSRCLVRSNPVMDEIGLDRRSGCST